MTECNGCHTPTEELALFPGGLCLECWKVTPEGRYLPTAAELRRLWGIR